MANKTETLRVRVTPETKAEISKYAEKIGLSLSAFVVMCLSEKCGEHIADKILSKK